MKQNIEDISVKIGFVESESKNPNDKLFYDLLSFGSCAIEIDKNGNSKRIDPRNLIVTKNIDK